MGDLASPRPECWRALLVVEHVILQLWQVGEASKSTKAPEYSQLRTVS